MEIFQKNKKIFLFVGIFLAVAIVYWLFFSGSSEGPKNLQTDPTARGLVSEISFSPADVIVGQELLLILSKLQSISLDDSIFSDPVFLSLDDKSKPISPQPLGKALGRRNPFSDFGKVNLSVPDSTASGAFGEPI